MSDTILGGKLTVYYLADSRRKQIRWTGTTAKDDVQKMIDVYDATEDLMTQPDQMDDGLIFSAETPGEYTIGRIDAGDAEPWFIDLKTMEHIIGDFANFTGCALKTSGWTRDLPGDGTGAVGIVVVPVTNIDIAVSDIGDTLSHADGDSGVLLDFIDTGGATDYLFIRPDDNALANDFNSTSGLITMDTTPSNQATQTAAAHTGEMVWGNPYTQGALANEDVHVFLFQDGAKVTISDDTDNDWWVDGHMDRAVPIKDYTLANFPTIDSGYLTVKANQYGSKYTYAIIAMNTTTGGNVSAGLSSGDDITNTTGYASITIAGGTGNWTAGDEIEGKVSGARAILTLVENPGATATLHYFYIGDPEIVFNGSEGIQNNDDTGDSTSSGAVSNEGPADTAWFDGSALPTFAFANTQVDIDDDGTTEEYGITIDLNQCSLSQMHEYNKYAMRRNSVLDLDGLDGQEWIGIDYAINYATITGTVPEGSVVTGQTSGATGVVVSNPGGSSNVALLRNSRGTFVNGEDIQSSTGNSFDATGLTVEVIVPVAEASFGILAGTTYFASRGVVLIDYKSAEENSFSLIDATGTPRARPTSISVTISNLKQYDYAACYRLQGTGLPIDKAEFDCAGGEAIGDPTLTVTDTPIPADVPGKTLGGTLVLVDVSDAGQEYVLRFDSYVAATGVFTLSNIVVTAETGTDTDTIVDTGAFANAKVGDLVVNITRSNTVSYITAVTDNDTIQISPAIAGQTGGDSIEVNAAPIAVDTADDVFVLIVFEFKTADGSASASMVYVSDFYAKAVVRNTSLAAEKIKGFVQEVPVTTGGGAAVATRIENTVYGS
jgi:hypothetical protein